MITIGGTDYEKKSINLNFIFGDTGTIKSILFSGSGKIHSYWMKVPDTTDGPTATLTIVNDEGSTIFSSGAKAENAEYNGTVDRIVDESGTANFLITLSAAAGSGGGTVEVILFFEFDKRRKIYNRGE